MTAGDVQEMAEKYIRPDNLHILAVGKAPAIADKLKKFGPVTYYDAYGNEIDPAKASLPADLNADKVIANYIEAIGGEERLIDVNDIKYELSADVMGNELEMDILKKEPNLVKIEVKMGENIVSSQVYDGENLKMIQMGNEIDADEKLLERMKIEGYVFPELNYDKLGVKTDLVGMETIDGSNAYAVTVTYPSGDVVTNYYDASSWYKVRQSQTVDSPQGQINTSTDFSEFRERNGIIFPFLFKIPRGPSMQMNAEVESIEINTGIEPDAFEFD